MGQKKKKCCHQGSHQNLWLSQGLILVSYILHFILILFCCCTQCNVCCKSTKMLNVKRYTEQVEAQKLVGQRLNPIFMKHTKSCWLTLEAIALASCVIVEGRAVISAALRPKIPKTTIVTIFTANLNRTVLRFHWLCTIVSVLRASPFQQECIHHTLSTSVTAACMLNLHVLVLHIGIKRL